MFNPGEFVAHRDTLSIYKVLTCLGETFVDYSGVIHETANYKRIEDRRNG